MLLVGSSPVRRNIEQHDVFFGIANSVADLIPDLNAFWPEAKDSLHVDAWRKVTRVDDYSVKVVDKQQANMATQLFFINLGGYKKNEFEEFHYKMIIAAKDKGEAIRQAKQTAFYKHTGFKGAPSHIDDKYGVGVDDVFAIEDILTENNRNKYSLVIQPALNQDFEDKIHLGYFKLDSVDRWDMS